MPTIDWDRYEMFNSPIGRQKLGCAGPAGTMIPADHADVTAQFNTTSAVLVDIPGMIVTLNVPYSCRYMCNFSADLDGTSGGNLTRIGYALAVDGVNGDEYFLDFANPDNFMAGVVTHLTPVLSAGTHVFTVRMRRVSGTQVATFYLGMLTVVALVQQ